MTPSHHHHYTRREIQAAWVVHSLTASGVIVGMLGLRSIVDNDSRGAIIWLIVALVLDGVDGPLARKLDVRNRVPLLNGNSLDLIIDYFTCAIVPVAFMAQFPILPSNGSTLTGFVILFVSALWMARVDQETEDGWFRGFPAEWNLVIPSLYLLHASPWLNLALCLALCWFTLSRVEFPHPVSVREHRSISITLMLGWIAVQTILGVSHDRRSVLRIGLVLAPLWTVWQVIDRARRPAESGPATDAAPSHA